MYRGFNLNLQDQSFNDTLKTRFASFADLEQKKIVSKQALDKHVLDDVINAKSLVEDWFAGIDADVFISHSHQDTSLATALAAYLHQTFGLKSFFDSNVWGYADELLRQIDDKYCLQEGGETYSYSKRNRSTSHVHLMLATALLKMIDRTECIFFLNTPQSIVSKELVRSDESLTASPWIFTELIGTEIIRQRIPHRIVQQRQAKDRSMILAQESLQVQYEVSLAHLSRIDRIDLDRWSKVPKKSVGALDALDALYELIPS